MAKAGSFEVTVSEPHPCWITVKRDGVAMKFHHNELADLQFALERAKQEAMRKLGSQYRDEVL